MEDEVELGGQLTARVATIDVAAFAKEARDAIIKAIRDNDLEALLRIYDRKKHIINTAARYLRGGQKDTFIGWVVRAIKDPKRAELRDAIKAVVPPINAT